MQKMDLTSLNASATCPEECGFHRLKVTQKSCDGGNDCTGRLKIKELSASMSLSVQTVKRALVGAIANSRVSELSYTTNNDKGVLITTGAFQSSEGRSIEPRQTTN